MPSFYETLFGGKDKMKKYPTMAPNQQNRFNQTIDNPIDQNPLYQSGSSYLQKILSGDPSAFEAFENPLIEQFEQKILPMISERFAGLGTGGGALSSSALNQTLGQAGRGLSNDLAAQRANLQGQAANQALGYAQQPYTNVYNQSQISPFAYGHQQGSEGLVSQLAAPLLQGAGTALGLNGFGGLSGFFGGGQQQQPSAPQIGWGQPGMAGYRR